ncbi:MAG: hypothetical protein KatS3mg104_2935 [Phycisphaerae bacterium]|nr:MAG: hypothetical protein KatS3mg104_2935 [Phycisphaerae bacterium]
MDKIHETKKIYKEATASLLGKYWELSYVLPVLKVKFVEEESFYAAMDTQHRTMYISTNLVKDMVPEETILEELLHFLLDHGKDRRGWKEMQQNKSVANVAIELERELFQQRINKKPWSFPDDEREILHKRILAKIKNKIKDETLELIFEALMSDEECKNLCEKSEIKITNGMLDENLKEKFSNGGEGEESEEFIFSDSEIEVRKDDCLTEIGKRFGSEKGNILEKLNNEKRIKMGLKKLKKIVASKRRGRSKTDPRRIKKKFYTTYPIIEFGSRRKDPNILVIVDVSGSMNSYRDLIMGTLEQMKKWGNVTFVFGDVKIAAVGLENAVFTGGGTNMKRVTEEAREMFSGEKIIVYFSDMISEFSPPERGEEMFFVPAFGGEDYGFPKYIKVLK